ncbi:unnamed protein product [Discosporangium mesarthrocarpum]
MIIARTLLSKLRPRRPTARELQEQLDISRAAVLTGAFAAVREGRVLKRHQLEKEVESLHRNERKRRVQSALNQQVIVAYFDLVDQETKLVQGSPPRKARAPRRIPAEDPDQYKTLLVADESEPGGVEREVDLETQLRKRILSELGYCPAVKESTIPGAGMGLFVEGCAPEGALVAIYPGLVHLPENLCEPDYIAELLPDDDFFLMARADGCVVDARTASGLPGSPFAVAQAANHPPEGMGANVLQTAYDFPSLSRGGVWGRGGGVFPEHLRPFIPNRYKLPPRLFGGKIDRWALVETVVLVAARKLQDEEVLMNYRFNPSLPAPEWYTPVDEEEARMRWAREEEQGAV